MAQELNIITAHDGKELGIINENPEGKDIINIPGRPPILTSSWTAIMAELQDVDTTPGEILKYLPFGLSFIYQEPMNILQLGVMSTHDGEMGTQILFRGDDSGSIDYKDDTDKREGPTLIILTGYNHTVAIYNPDLRKQEKLVTELLENPNLWKMALDYRVAITAPTERLDDDDKTWAVIEQSLGVVSDKSREYLLAQAADAIDAETREAAGSSAQHAASSSGAAAGSSAQHAALSSRRSIRERPSQARINAEALRAVEGQITHPQDERTERELARLKTFFSQDERTERELAWLEAFFSPAAASSSADAAAGGHNKRKTKRIKKTKHTKTKHSKTKHTKTKHTKTKRKNTKHTKTKRKNTKHTKTKRKNTKHTKTKRKNTKHKKTKRKNTKHKKTKLKQIKH